MENYTRILELVEWSKKFFAHTSNFWAFDDFQNIIFRKFY